MTRAKKERGYSCYCCWASITVIGPDSQIDQALRRVGWERAGGKVVCRNCRQGRCGKVAES